MRLRIIFYRGISVLALISLLLFAAEGFMRLAYSRSLAGKMPSSHTYESLALIGVQNSGVILDKQGEWINEGRPTELVIGSKRRGEQWERPEKIVIRNLRLRGSIRIKGMGRNGEGSAVRESSRRLEHTARAQAAAPTEIMISNLWIEAVGRIPIYLAPGVTEVTIANCFINGHSKSTAIYLDAESADNVISNNTFNIRCSREVMAIDGSASNRIENNHFANIRLGGIYLYRNCGEGGTVRHQTPHGNTIADNHFTTSGLNLRSYAIWIGSRNGRRGYCHCDDGYPFGSSIDNRDFADSNLISNNIFLPATNRDIRDNGENNRIVSNRKQSLH